MTRTLIASALLTFASAASASSPIVYHLGDPPTAFISTRDVNLGTIHGRTVVERRIVRAAREVCSDAEDGRSALEPRNLYADCYDIAVAKGVSQLEQLAGE